MKKFFWWSGTLLLGLLLMGAAKQQGSEESQKTTQTWTLRSGALQLGLRQGVNGLERAQFGATSGSLKLDESTWRPDISGRIEGRDLAARDLRLISAKASKVGGKEELRLTLRHRLLPLEVTAFYTAWGETGVITRHVTLRNQGKNVLHIDSFPSLSWILPGGEYDLTTLQGGWGKERQVVTEKLGATPKIFDSESGRSTSKFAAWFSLHNEKTGLRYLAQLAWSGNWQMSFDNAKQTSATQNNLMVTMEPRFDYGGAVVLSKGETLELPEVAFTVTTGDLDDAANLLHRYQNQYVVPRNPSNEPPMVQFNTWYALFRESLDFTLDVATLKRYADGAADLGCEVFVIDYGWFGTFGEWKSNPKMFPNGVSEIARYVHSKGMKFGLWVEIENIVENSPLRTQHPDWCIQRDGAPIYVNPRYQLNFAKPAAYAWARDVMDRLIRENQLDWVKIDYNHDIGNQMDADDGTRPGNILFKHVQAYYKWVDELHADYPKLVIENCASGGLRFDLGMIARSHTYWISDRVFPKPSVQLAYGSTLEFIPKVCNHWMVGDQEEGGTVDLKNSEGWWDFMFRVPMNGQLGISSRIFDWSPEFKQCAKRNVTLYKRLRSVIAEGDCYHLTPPPPNENPKGWAAMQYVTQDQTRSVVLAYRLGDSSAEKTFRLKGLDPRREYSVTQDGQKKGKGTFTGRELAEKGLSVVFPDEWRACAIELRAQSEK